MKNYFRITAYHPKEDCSIIIDSYGLFDKIWKFSADLVQKGFKIIEVGTAEKFLDGNIEKSCPETDKFILRSYGKGRPEDVWYIENEIKYKAITVGEKTYIPDRTVTV